MASASIFLSHPKPYTNDVVFSSSRSRFQSFSLACQSNLFGSKFTSKSISLSTAGTRPGLASSSDSEPISASPPHQTFDVLIIGAGIIGLTIARQFLIGSDLSVAVIDKAVPCSGATGAGNVILNLSAFFLAQCCWVKSDEDEMLTLF